MLSPSTSVEDCILTLEEEFKRLSNEVDLFNRGQSKTQEQTEVLLDASVRRMQQVVHETVCHVYACVYEKQGDKM